MSSDGAQAGHIALSIEDVGKCFHVYRRPQDRLKQALWRWRRTFYDEFWALRHVSFEVKRGDAVGVIGRNGSGKSTLLQIIAGTLTPTEGAVRVAGRIGALLELGSGFNPDFTGRENVYLNGAVLGLSRDEVEARFDDIAAFADIGQFLDQPVKTYSSGMHVRLAFAVAASIEPDILIVDEALAVGDMFFQAKCVARIRKLMDSGTTLLLVSHSPETVRSLCPRCVWLERGQVKMDGPAKAVTHAYAETLFIENNSVTVERALEQPVNGTEEKLIRQAAIKLRTGSAESDGSLIVRSVALVNENGAPVHSLRPGERFSIDVVLAASADVDHVSVGLLIKDRLGIELTGESVFNKLRRGLRLEAGRPVTVRFAAQNNLRPDDYTAAVRVNRVSRWDRSDNVLLYNDDTALVFKVLGDPDQPMWFRFRHPFEVTVT